MPRVRIMCMHPISNPNGAEPWDGKVYDAPYFKDIEDAAKWCTSKVGIKFSLNPRDSRYINGRPVLFPARRTTGVHCMIIEEVSS